MNIISYNVRELGRDVKSAAIRRLIKKENVDMICIQETERESIDKTMCQSLWGDADVSWETQPTVIQQVVFYTCGVNEHLNCK